MGTAGDPEVVGHQPHARRRARPCCDGDHGTDLKDFCRTAAQSSASCRGNPDRANGSTSTLRLNLRGAVLQPVGPGYGVTS
jgi:hypothetical protein